MISVGDWLQEQLNPKDPLGSVSTAVFLLAISSLAQWAVLALLVLRMYGRI